MRNPVLSFALSLTVPGLGQLYNGEVRKALIFVVVPVPLVFLCAKLGLMETFAGLILVILLTVAFQFAIAFQAYRSSRKLRNYELQWVNKVGIYLIYSIIVYSGLWTGLLFSREINGYETFSIPTAAMVPEVQIGDHIMATRVDLNDIKPGDILTHSPGPGEKYMTRLIGLPGQEIMVKDDRVIIDGVPEQWVLKASWSAEGTDFNEYQTTLPNGSTFPITRVVSFGGVELPQFPSKDMGPTIVPEGYVFVMSDFRNLFRYDRTYMMLPYENLEKKVRYIFWSDDPDRIGTTFH